MKNYRYVLVAVVTIFLWQTSIAQSPGHEHTIAFPLSSEAEKDFEPCWDTINAVVYKHILDANRMTPSWHPVIGSDAVSVLEGQVIPNHKGINPGTHIAPIDLPLYHFTHDFTFNVLPDKTPDNRYSRLLARQLEPVLSVEGMHYDTVLQKHIHVEWESGLGANNKKNPCTEPNAKGESCGLYSKGHQRGDKLWNWPTIGDWVHLEGLWVWDRGHPPAYTEIHPIRFSAVRRQLPTLIELETGEKVYATRIDIYANGDGGALFNNRANMPDYVTKVKMGSKDYSFDANPIIPQPSANAQLKFKVVSHKGDSYTGNMTTGASTKNNKPAAQISIPWKGLPDTLTFARTVYVYWDEADGKPDNYAINTYKVTIESIKFRHNKESFSRPELRVFVEVGGDWFFVNEFSPRKKVLGKGKRQASLKKNNTLQSFTLYLPDRASFRVHVGGWEADGANRTFGWLFDPYSPCNDATTKGIRKKMAAISPLAFRGCIDDHIGEINDRHIALNLRGGGYFETFSDGDKVDDVCLFSWGNQKKVFKVKYTIERVVDK